MWLNRLTDAFPFWGTLSASASRLCSPARVHPRCPHTLLPDAEGGGAGITLLVSQPSSASCGVRGVAGLWIRLSAAPTNTRL